MRLMVATRTIACPKCGAEVRTDIPYRKSILCGRCNLFSELHGLVLEAAAEPQRNLHFPLNRTARTRDGRGGWNRKPQGAVVVMTYDMRGRIGLMEDEVRAAAKFYHDGDRENLRRTLVAMRALLDGAVEVLGTEVPVSGSKG